MLNPWTREALVQVDQIDRADGSDRALPAWRKRGVKSKRSTTPNGKFVRAGSERYSGFRRFPQNLVSSAPKPVAPRPAPKTDRTHHGYSGVATGHESAPIDVRPAASTYHWINRGQVQVVHTSPASTQAARSFHKGDYTRLEVALGYATNAAQLGRSL